MPSNLEIVKKTYTDYEVENPDYDAIYGAIHPQIEIYARTMVPPRTIVGIAEYKAYIHELETTWPDFRIENLDCRQAADGKVLVIADILGTRANPEEGEDLMHRSAWLWQVMDDKLYRCWDYPNPDVGINAIGLAKNAVAKL